MKERNVILHCHLFKNAGTTLDWALQRSFGSGFIDHRDDMEMRQYGIDYLDQFLGNQATVRALSSHHMPFMPEYKKPFYWLLLLREPISRIRSVYEFEVKQPVSSLGSEMAKQMDLSEYINWRMQDDVQPVIKNFYARYLCNKAIPDEVINDLDMECAIQRLSLNNVLVGTVERFDESMVFFEESLKGSFPGIDLSYIRQNIGSYESGLPLSFLDEISPEPREFLLDNNQLDKELHAMISSELEKKIHKIHDFDNKLDSFKKRCDSLL
jgi:hypothetical protein